MIMPQRDDAILDLMPGYQRLAICRDGVLTDVLVSDASDLSPSPGAIYLARVADRFANHGRVRLNLGDAGEASMRTTNTEEWPSGKRIVITIQAEARDNKPPQARVGMIRENPFAIIQCQSQEPKGVVFSRRLKQALEDHPSPDLEKIVEALEPLTTLIKARITLRQSAHHKPLDQVLSSIKADLDELAAISNTARDKTHPGMLAQSPDLPRLCSLILPNRFLDQGIAPDDDGAAWAEAGIDQQIDAALTPSLPLQNGGVIHINTPPGAAVIDGDSASSRLSPDELAHAMITPLTTQLRLRRISGPVVIDFPRLGRTDADSVHLAMTEATATDPLPPRLYGWTKGGLYTLDRPYRWRRLDQLLGDQAKTEALTAMRLAWQQSKRGGGDGKPYDIAISEPAMKWLEADGKPVRDALTTALPLPPRWIIL